MAGRGAAVGIDIGSGYCRVGVWQANNQRVEIVTNNVGNRSSPCVVAFNDHETIECESALAQAHKNPSGTLFCIRDLVGHNISDALVKEELESLGVKYVETGNGNFSFVVNSMGKEEQFTPEDILALLIQKKKSTAESYVGEPIQRAVFTVPSAFTASQRHAVVASARQAGLEVVQLISESAAVAMAYGLDCPDHFEDSKPHFVVVVDAGSSSCDVTLMKVQRGILQSIDSKSTSEMSGDLLDAALQSFFMKQFQKQSGIDISDRPKAMRRLRQGVEILKCSLSHGSQGTVDLDSLADGIDLHSRLTRARFDILASRACTAARECVEQLLENNRLCASQIEEVLLAGGLVSMPCLRAELESVFDGRDIFLPTERISTREKVCEGATLQAALLTGALGACPVGGQGFPKPEKAEKGEEETTVVPSVTVLDLGIALQDGSMKCLVPRGTLLPFSITEEFSTNSADQSSVSIKLLEGLSESDSEQLAALNLDVPSGSNKISVQLSCDLDGKLTITVSEPSTNSSSTISVDCGSPSEKQQKMISEALKIETEKRDNLFMNGHPEISPELDEDSDLECSLDEDSDLECSLDGDSDLD
eukprot:559248_1